MNNSYFSTSSNEYTYEYASPAMPTYVYSPSHHACPIHSPYSFYSSPIPSMPTSPVPYSYPYQQQLPILSPLNQQHANVPTNVDRTPLRRHHCFKKKELQILHQIYIQDAYPSVNILQQLAIQLKVSVDKIRQWFKNRRHSDKQKNQATAHSSNTK